MTFKLHFPRAHRVCVTSQPLQAGTPLLSTSGASCGRGMGGFQTRCEPLEGDMTPILGGGSPGIQAAAPGSDRRLAKGCCGV